jgi:hypothetical protein
MKHTLKNWNGAGRHKNRMPYPDSRLMAANGKMEVCYNVQTAVDAQNKLIAAFAVTNDGTDKNQITPMAEQTKTLLGTDTLTIVADAGYDRVQDIVESMARGVNPQVAGTDFDLCVPTNEPVETAPVSHKEGRCVYIAERNIVLCPMGKTGTPSSGAYGRRRFSEII